jgi:hypothetical protein
MMLLQNAIADTLNNNDWAFPLAECVHIGGFAAGVGSIALVDFRMLNLGLRIFPHKMYVLLAALTCNLTVHRKVATMEKPPPVLSGLVAIISLLLWVSIVFGGIFTGFLE